MKTPFHDIVRQVWIRLLLPALDGLQAADQSLGGGACVMVLRGDTWKAVGRSGFSPGATQYVSLAAAQDGTLAVAFEDQANGYATSVMALH